MTGRKALGKGLSALIPDEDAIPARPELTLEVPTASLDPNPYQPRSVFAPGPLAELVASIRESGLVQPLLVRRRGERYEIVAGERRHRAAAALGLATVPVVVRDVPDDRLLELALVENIQRAELTPLEEAHAYERLQRELGLTQDEIAKRVGKERPTVANTLRLLRLPKEVRELLAEGKLDAGHGRALLALERAEAQVALGREAVRRGLSVRELERRVARDRAPRGKKEARRDPNTRAAEEKLRGALGARVEIRRQGRAGFLKVPFANEAELQRLFDLLVKRGR
jgi:ParB family transcriptional regulator, chromosome partitioning protein